MPAWYWFIAATCRAARSLFSVARRAIFLSLLASAMFCAFSARRGPYCETRPVNADSSARRKSSNCCATCVAALASRMSWDCNSWILSMAVVDDPPYPFDDKDARTRSISATVLSVVALAAANCASRFVARSALRCVAMASI